MRHPQSPATVFKNNRVEAEAAPYSIAGRLFDPFQRRIGWCGYNQKGESN